MNQGMKGKNKKALSGVSHTPGPWKRGNSTTVFTNDLIKCVADTGLLDSAINHDEAIANADLIASAPDLLQACETAVYWLKQNESDFRSLALLVLEEAIAKATRTS